MRTSTTRAAVRAWSDQVQVKPQASDQWASGLGFLATAPSDRSAGRRGWAPEDSDQPEFFLYPDATLGPHMEGSDPNPLEGSGVSNP